MRGDTWYVVVTREGALPIKRFMSLGDAGDYVFYERNYAIWRILAQQGKTASAPYRELTLDERKRVERRFFPSLFE